jgi:hypothetical protein
VRSPWRESRRRRAAWFGLIVAVLLAHAAFGVRVLSSVIGWNGADEPRRIEITLTKQVVPTAPTPMTTAPPATPPEPLPPRAVRVARAGSAPVPASAPEESASAPTPERALSESHKLLASRAFALAASAAEAAQPAVVASAAASASAGVAIAAAPTASGGTVTLLAGSGVSAPVAGPPRLSFDWPPSTRLTYTLTGLFRNGPLYGRASVEWRREGTHYQVQFDIHVSPFFDQHMFSDGQITEGGLSPQHYDEAFEVPLLAPRVRRIEFSPDEVTLANGTRVIRLPQTQDGASQFVQFVWMFSTRPELLNPGNVIDIPLALNSNLRRWHYRVEGVESLRLPFGSLDAVHLKPMLDGPRRPNEYPFEIWTAPTLQYLPVRILVPIDDKNFADLSLDALPLQAAPVPGNAASPSVLR